MIPKLSPQGVLCGFGRGSGTFGTATGKEWGVKK